MGESATEHDFQVTAIEPSDDEAIDGIAIRLTDARGGRVRLRLPLDLAETLRERISAALDKRQGP